VEIRVARAASLVAWAHPDASAHPGASAALQGASGRQDAWVGARLGAERLRDGRPASYRMRQAACRLTLQARRPDPKAQEDAWVAVQPGTQEQQEPQFPASERSQVPTAAQHQAPPKAERRASLEPLAELRSERGAPAPEEARQSSASPQQQAAQAKQTQTQWAQTEQPEPVQQWTVRAEQQTARAALSA
jgi:hypothetical protein